MRKKMLEKLALSVAAMVMAFKWTVFHTSPALADDAADTKQLVEKSKLTFDTFVVVIAARPWAMGKGNQREGGT